MNRHTEKSRTETHDLAPAAEGARRGGIHREATTALQSGRSDSRRVPKPLGNGAKGARAVGLAPSALQERIWLRALSMLARFRVMRTLDVAVRCFPERGFKAALTAAQRAVRGLVKAKLIARYKTDRFQTIYGLTSRGAAWLDERGVDAASSVRRVSDMSNPEHRLWAQFLVLCCEARGLRAESEQELLISLNAGRSKEQGLIQGLLALRSPDMPGRAPTSLRPDLVATEPRGCTWFEVDRSKRSAEREQSLRNLVLATGAKLLNGQALARVVVFAKTERIEQRAMAVLAKLMSAHADQVLTEGRRQVRGTDTPGLYEVWAGVLQQGPDRRQAVVDRLVGYVSIQRLPTWLPKARVDGTGRHSFAGWLGENYLPYINERGWTKAT